MRITEITLERMNEIYKSDRIIPVIRGGKVVGLRKERR